MATIRIVLGILVALLSGAGVRAQTPDLAGLANTYRVDFSVRHAGDEERHASAIVREGSSGAVELRSKNPSASDLRIEFSVVEDQSQSARTGAATAQVLSTISTKRADKSALLGKPEIFVLLGSEKAASVSMSNAYELQVKVRSVAPQALVNECSLMSGKPPSAFDLPSMLSKLSSKPTANPMSGTNLAKPCCCCSATCPRTPSNTIFCCNVICCSDGVCGGSCCTGCGSTCT